MGPTAVVFNLGPEREASSPASLWSTARRSEGTGVLRAESSFGWRWRRPPECKGSPATRKPAAELREELAPVDSGCNREGRQRGNGKRGEAVCRTLRRGV